MRSLPGGQKIGLKRKISDGLFRWQLIILVRKAFLISVDTSRGVENYESLPTPKEKSRTQILSTLYQIS